jgi:creatinine amidohydrolase
MKCLTILFCLCALLAPSGHAQMAVPGQGLTGMNVDEVVEMEFLTQTELAEKVASGWTSVMVPTGGTEIRGPHAILAVHTLLASRRAVEAAKRVGNTLVAPTIPFAVAASGGFNDAQWTSFLEDGATAPNPGGISVTAEVFKGIQEGYVESLAYIGFKDIFLMGDHGGGQNEMRVVVEEMTAKLASRGVQVHYVGDFYAKTHDDINMYMYEHQLPVAGHGGMMETSEMMYWEPTEFAYIRPNYKTVPYDGTSDDYEGWKAAQDARAAGRGRGAGGRGAANSAERVNNGLSGNPHPATKEIGADLAEIGISNTATQVRQLLAERYGRNR